MLTKDLVQYRTRNGKVFPGLLDVNDAELLAMAADLTQLFEQCEGKTLGELEAELGESAWSLHQRMPALKKLLFDRCDEAEDSGEVGERRWQVLQRAEALRTGAVHATLAEFQGALAADQGAALATLRDNLYGDLLEHRQLTGFKPLTPLALLHRHNCAQIQGLLLHATEVKVTLKGGTVAERRRFFRCLKFQRLLSEVAVDAGVIRITLSGPLRIFQNTQSYGMRLATFFPYVLQMPEWILEASLKLAGNPLTLSLDQKTGIASHYRELTPFLPPELTAFVDVFNERGGEWHAAPGDDYVHLGRQSYCFPDVTLTNWMKHVVHLELFHRWHAGQLVSRLRALEANPSAALLLGVADELKRDESAAAAIASSAWFSRNGFGFKAFPTPKAVLAALSRRGAGQQPGAPPPPVSSDAATDLQAFWGDPVPSAGATAASFPLLAQREKPIPPPKARLTRRPPSKKSGTGKTP